MPTSLPPPRLFDPLQDKPLLPQCAQIQADCIIQDGQLATFLPPLDLTKMINYWVDLSEQVERGELAIILQMAPDEASGKGESSEVAGYVCLKMPFAETGPFRGSVLKLMVSTKFRRMGIARRVMQKLEEVAREKHRELLVSVNLSNGGPVSMLTFKFLRRSLTQP